MMLQQGKRRGGELLRPIKLEAGSFFRLLDFCITQRPLICVSLLFLSSLRLQGFFISFPLVLETPKMPLNLALES